MNKDDIWVKFLDLIKKELNPVSFGTWFGETTLYDIDDKKITLLVPMALHKRFLLSHYYDLINSCFMKVTGKERDIDCIMKDEIENSVEKTVDEVVNNNEVINNEIEEFSLIFVL